jgi:Tol biopolymer transport system component
MIAFSRLAEESGGIYIVPALGGQERRLVEQGGDFYLRTFLSWSPDGKLLAYAAPAAQGGVIHLLDMATLASRALPMPSSECQWTMIPAFSPDGKSLATACLVKYGIFAVFAGPVSGDGARKVAVVEGGGVSGLTYSADGRYLFYANGSTGDLWRVGLDAGAPEKLLAGRDAHMPAVARAGQRLAYTQQVENTNIWRITLADRLRAAGPPQALISSSRAQYSASFSPDGRQVAFVSNRSGSGEIWICSADGSDPVALTSFGGPLTGSPSWSPDGHEIAFDSRVSGQAEAFAVRVDGGVPRRLDTGIANSSQPSWSRDGKWIYFIAGSDQKPQVYRMPSAGGPAVALTKQGGYWPQESPDSRRVYYVRGTQLSELWSVAAEGGDEAAVAEFPRLDPSFRTNWAVVRGGIYFVDATGPKATLAFFDLVTRRVLRVLDLPRRPQPYSDSIAVSPDGHSILLSQRERISSDIMLVEDFEGPPLSR